MPTPLRFAAALLIALTAALPSLAQTPTPATRPAAPPPPRSAPAATPTPAPAPAAAVTPVTASRIDVNSATEQQLDALPGVGPARAKAIVAHRPYADLAELVSKRAIPQNVLDGARARLALANINTSSAADLQRSLPGIGDVRARAIVSARPFAKPEDLVGKGVLTQAVFDKIKDLVAF